MKKKLLLFVLLTSQYSILTTKGNTYVVTSNVNGTTTDGVSLRWAITQAVANPGPDTITFNIPGRAPQTITLLTALPWLTGTNANGTVIDGTTQPANGFSGVSPKIIINGNGFVSGALTYQAANCAVYGLCITNFRSGAVQFGYGGDNFIFGAPGKGNVINNVPGLANGLYLSGVSGGIIQGNKIGTDTTGTVASSVDNGINANTVRNILIGGGGAGEGNLISGQTGFGSCNILLIGSTYVTIQGNIIGPDINLNYIYSDDSAGIDLIGTDSCIIGGSGFGEGNIIGYNIDDSFGTGAGIFLDPTTHADLMSRNSIFCNGDGGGISSSGNNFYPAPAITSAYTNIANGTASPKAIVELFYNQSGCTTIIYGCSGETYIGTVNADALGNWSYYGTLAGGSEITATATDSANNTSDFANCFTVSTLTNVNGVIEDNSFNIYPNPVHSTFTIEVNEDMVSRDCELRLYDVFGREVLASKITEPTTTIDKGSLSQGIYFYQLISGENIVGKGKVVVE